MDRDVAAFVQTCVICAQDKADHSKQAGLLQPLPIPDRPWASVSMDFITCLPPSGGYTGLYVVVCRLTKYAHFIPYEGSLSARQTAELFFKNVVKIHGLPKEIVSDRDGRFTGAFWQTLFAMCGTQLLFSSSYHPQTDGQTEIVNQIIEDYLRHYVRSDQKNWSAFVDCAEFCYNSKQHSSTGFSPFELAYGYKPVGPGEAAVQQITGGVAPAGGAFHEEWVQHLEQAKKRLDKAQARMKKQADRKRRHQEYLVGSKVYLKIDPRQFELPLGTTDRLARRYDGPFLIVERIGQVAYRLKLPEHMHVHPVFHVSMLKREVPDMDPNREQVRRGPALVVDRGEDETLEAIVSHKDRPNQFGPNRLYFCRWQGQTANDQSWRTAASLWRFENQVEEYNRLHPFPDMQGRRKRRRGV